MGMIDVVKWDGTPDIFAWKHPSEALSTWTQLVVNETQEAFLVKAGVYIGPFGAGRHTLSTENVPGLSALIGLPFGGRSPFTAEVWFVNRVANLDIRWGTPDPIQLQDPKYKLMLPVRAFGQYGVRIIDPRTFLTRLVGTLPVFNAASVSTYFRGTLLTRIKTEIANAIITNGQSVLDVSTELGKLSEMLRVSLSADMATYGVGLSQFNINSINVPDSDPAVQTLKNALAKRAEMTIVGFNYQQERSFDVMEHAASNEGTAGAVLSTSLGAGMGIAMGMPLGNSLAQTASHLQTEQAKPVPQVAVSSLAERLQSLRELGELRTQGILTDAEFEVEKRRILSGQ